ncbi:MAG: class I SAM-dependent methyltransferase [Polyangiaceae bacterium]|nr:class I SAM-dependent methyltransferase [Polyangiaceae bacterium]
MYKSDSSKHLPPELEPSCRENLSSGSIEHYAEPLYYDKCYAKRQHDVEYYKSIAASAKTVLEHGCGNGRIVIPSARDGIEVVGVDMSGPMLEAFRNRMEAEPIEVRDRIHLIQADMRTINIVRRFDLVICAFNTFLHLYNRVDVEQFLSRVRSQLAPGARFAFDTSLPLPEELGRDPRRPFRVPRMKLPQSGQIVRYAEYFDYERMSQVLKITMRFEPVDDPDGAWTVLLTHRQYYPQEIETLLHYNGFVLESVHPNMGGGEREVDSIGWVAKARG